MNALSVHGLSKTFKGGLFGKDHRVLRDVSFSLPAGLTTGFVGGNGQGKTTTIKCLLEFIWPDGGEVLFFGKPLDREGRRRLGYLPERPYLYEFLTGREFLRLGWDLSGGPPGAFAAKAAELLSLVELTTAADLRLRSYSKGMLQRIGLAQALLSEPELLILDEPMSGLDPDGRALVKEILAAKKKAGVTLFFSSHLLQDMDDLCDRLVVIDGGAIAFEGTPADFRRDQADLEKAFRIFRRKQHSEGAST